jgi:hypothetical protein
MGREPSPIDNGVLTLMEYASAVHARALEMNMKIHQAETNGQVQRGDTYYKFRTGELRDFIDMAKAAMDLGSRRLTNAQLAFDMQEQASW